MRTTISIQDPLLETAKEQASMRRITLSALIEDALRVHLAAGNRRQQRPSFRLITVKGKLVDEGVDLNRTSQLIARDDEDFYREKR